MQSTRIFAAPAPARSGGAGVGARSGRGGGAAAGHVGSARRGVQADRTHEANAPPRTSRRRIAAHDNRHGFGVHVRDEGRAPSSADGSRGCPFAAVSSVSATRGVGTVRSRRCFRFEYPNKKGEYPVIMVRVRRRGGDVVPERLRGRSRGLPPRPPLEGVQGRAPRAAQRRRREDGARPSVAGSSERAEGRSSGPGAHTPPSGDEGPIRRGSHVLSAGLPRLRRSDRQIRWRMIR